MNEACCSRPPVASDYEPTGTYVTLKNGMKSYKVGPSSAKRGIIMIYDAFGYSQPQLLGADLVSSSLSALVFSPDFFRGQAVDKTVFELSPEERGKKFGEFISGPGSFPKGVENATQILKDLRAEYPDVKSWGVHGYCWGGKISAIVSAQKTDYVVSGASHPGQIDPQEAKALTIPHISLLSGEDGSSEDAAAYAKALKESGQDVVYERFEDQVHGWMAARADLQQDRVKAEFTRGYDMLIDFFGKHL